MFISHVTDLVSKITSHCTLHTALGNRKNNVTYFQREYKTMSISEVYFPLTLKYQLDMYTCTKPFQTSGNLQTVKHEQITGSYHPRLVANCGL